MRRFLSIWLVLIVIGVFALAMLITAPLVTRASREAAIKDLNQLLDAGESLLDEAQMDAEAVSAGSQSNILAKARAVSRFLAHDDELLQTDALVSMCELLEVSAVDVTDYAGVVIASSVAGRIGRSLIDEPGLAWAKEVLDGEGLERTRADSVESALLWGCVPRADTEGFVLIQSLDRAILTAKELANPEAVLRSVSFIQDELAIAEQPGSDGDYVQNDRCYVRRTHTLPDGAGELSLLASRPLSSVYVPRNLVLLVLALFMLACILLALLVQSLLRSGGHGAPRIAFLRQSTSVPSDGEPAANENFVSLDTLDTSSENAPLELPAQDLPDDPLPELPAQDLPDDVGIALENAVLLISGDKPVDRRKDKPAKRKKRQKLFEFVPVEPDGDAPTELPAQDLPDDAGIAPESADADMTAAAYDPAWPPAQDLPDECGDLFPTPPSNAAKPAATHAKKTARRTRKQMKSDAAPDVEDAIFDKIFD